MSNQLNPRRFAKLIGATGVALPLASLPGYNPSDTNKEKIASEQNSDDRSFPKDFYWRVATSSYQVKVRGMKMAKASLFGIRTCIRSFVEGGYRGFQVKVGGGKVIHIGGAPGLKLSTGALNQVKHHAVLGHSLAVQAIRANGPADTKLGFAENMLIPVPVVETPECIKAAETATRELNADFTTVMLEGRYTDNYLARAGADAPKFTDDELKIIASPLDFVGINVYKPNIYILPSTDPRGYREVTINASHPKMQSSWHVFDPECIYWAPHHVQALWGAKSIFITENGCAASDVVAKDGNVYDSDRVMFLRAYLIQLQRATADNVPADGYFLWSAQDNFEWNDGYGNRFGLIYVDFKTQKRTPKMSAMFFKEVAKANKVV